jgi:methylenetetrahydrofolate reductase (NADPH)
VEFFCSSENLHALIGKVKENPSLTYIAVNAKGETQSNIGPPMMLLPGVCSQGRKLFN